MNFYAGLDVGGTSGRVKFVDPDGKLIGEYLGEGCAYNTEGPENGRVKYNALLKEALSEYGLKSEDCLGICTAASGVDSPEQAETLRKIFIDMGFAAEKLLVVNDCELFLYLSEGASMVVISGTGSICFGRDDEGRVYRTGGWNHILSDEGSAFDIGLQTIKAMADCLDGRIPETLLKDRVMQETGIRNLEEADRYVNEHLLDKSPVGKLAAVCAAAAEEGDEAAVGILRDCAGKIYRLVFDTWCKLHVETADLWLWGSVLVKNESFRNYVKELAAADMPGVRIRIPEAPALDIAVMTAVRIFAKKE